MDRATLKARHKATVERWWRSLDDGNGVVPPGLLAELNAIAEEHATDAVNNAALMVAYDGSKALRKGRSTGGEQQ